MFGFNSKRSFFLFTALMVLVAVAASAGTVAYLAKDGALPSASAQNTPTAPTAQATSVALPGLNPNSIADIVEKAGPAVVKIVTTSQTTVFNDPFFRQFFWEDFGLEPQSRVTQGLGSGFIISEDGYILTNEHVIDKATDIQVQVEGYEKTFTAKVVGKDYDLDLAVLKIESDKPLPTLPLGDSDKVKVGDWVVAIGNPLGLDHTVTVGVISAKSRPITVENRRFTNLLQTDASINPGNSGGPLLNLKGEVIGINNAINADAQGIGFAIPASTVKEVLDELITTGKIARPWIGVYMQAITKELMNYYNLPSQDGVIITSVIPGSPAAKAGLKRGDVILELNKQPIKSPTDLQDLVKNLKIGQKVPALIWRNGKTMTVTLTITEKQQPN